METISGIIYLYILLSQFCISFGSGKPLKDVKTYIPGSGLALDGVETFSQEFNFQNISLHLPQVDLIIKHGDNDTWTLNLIVSSILLLAQVLMF
jgi:hypothetical protein